MTTHPHIPPGKRTHIRHMLTWVQREHNVRVLMAVESGSRAWGFPSPNSDFDVRFIFVRPRDEYLRLDTPEQQINLLEDDLDLVGWDLYKAAGLLVKSNPSLVEWLSADKSLRYVGESDTITQLRAVLQHNGSLLAMGHHYLSMAQTNWGKYVRGYDQVRLKKYLYAARPLLCAMHLLRWHSVPQLEFGRVCATSEAPRPVLRAIEQLVDRKVRHGRSELDETDRIKVLDQFLARMLEGEGELELRARIHDLPRGHRLPPGRLDAILLSEVAKS